MEELWKLFRLSEKEKDVMDISFQEVALSKQQIQFSILFKLKINKDYNKEAFKSTIQHLWLCPHGVIIREVGNNLFLAIFIRENTIEDFIETF